MIRRTTVLTTVFVLGGMLVAVAAPAPAARLSTLHRARGTVRTVIRPVTARGHHARGYTVRGGEGRGPVRCSKGQTSVAAVNRNIAMCTGRCTLLRPNAATSPR